MFEFVSLSHLNLQQETSKFIRPTLVHIYTIYIVYARFFVKYYLKSWHMAYQTA